MCVLDDALRKYHLVLNVLNNPQNTENGGFGVIHLSYFSLAAV